MSVFVEPVSTDERGRFARLRADSLTELQEFMADTQLKGEIDLNLRIEELTFFRISPKERRSAIRAGAEKLDWSECHRRINQVVIVRTRTPLRVGVGLGPRPTLAHS